jgi:hypothetical protein
MNTQTTIRLKSPVDLITSLPYQFGFHPKRSVVLVCLMGDHVGLVERLDIPPPEHALDAMHAMVEPMLKERPTSVVLLGYEDIEGESVPLLNTLRVAISNPHLHPSIELTDVLVVRDGRWYSRVCKDPTCCPTEGTPLAENVAVTSEFVALGHNPLSSREDVAARLEPTPEAVGPLQTDAAEMPEHHTMLLSVGADVWAKVMTTGKLTSLEVAYAAFALRDIGFRDAMVNHLWPGVLAAEQISQQIQDIFSVIPPITKEGAIDRLIDLCAAIKDSEAAPALTVLANYAWFLGDGPTARMALDRALRCDPKYGLALLLERMVDLAIRPEPAA